MHKANGAQPHQGDADTNGGCIAAMQHIVLQHGHSHGTPCITAATGKKFFGSFFQERTPSFSYPLQPPPLPQFRHGIIQRRARRIHQHIRLGLSDST